MKAYHHDDWLTIHAGDNRAVLPTLEAGSVHTVVTSPPYWGLRDYGVSGQLGLEPTPEEYVANMVAVFREVRRVLRDDGTCWLNLGDSYAGYHGNAKVADADAPSNKPGYVENMRATTVGVGGLKPKDLVGIPWRVAFALQADGWYLRSDIIWSKPNPMPESVTDRPTKAHEYLFLLAKSERYYFDADAVREGFADERMGASGARSLNYSEGSGRHDTLGGEGKRGLGVSPSASGRNIRSVWTIATQPYPGAHFATFPPKLVEPCILAGTSERGVCPECGAPWRRVVERVGAEVKAPRSAYGHGAGRNDGGRSQLVGAATSTTGWRPTCAHADTPTVPGVVLDPFGGSGTTAMVAQHLGRRAVLIELNPDYITQQLRRNAAVPLGLEATA